MTLHHHCQVTYKRLRDTLDALGACAAGSGALPGGPIVGVVFSNREPRCGCRPIFLLALGTPHSNYFWASFMGLNPMHFLLSLLGLSPSSLPGGPSTPLWTTPSAVLWASRSPPRTLRSCMDLRVRGPPGEGTVWCPRLYVKMKVRTKTVTPPRKHPSADPAPMPVDPGLYKRATAIRRRPLLLPVLLQLSDVQPV